MGSKLRFGMHEIMRRNERMKQLKIECKNLCFHAEKENVGRFLLLTRESQLAIMDHSF